MILRCGSSSGALWLQWGALWLQWGALWLQCSALWHPRPPASPARPPPPRPSRHRARSVFATKPQGGGEGSSQTTGGGGQTITIHSRLWVRNITTKLISTIQ